MRNFWQHMKMDYLLSSVMSIVLGIVFIVWRGGVINMLGTVIAIAMIVFGAVIAGSFLLNAATNGFAMFAGVLLVVLGIWFMIMPAALVSMIPVVIGVLLLSHGLRAIKEAVSAAKYGYNRIGASVAMGIISMACGVICIFDAFGVMEKAIALVGVVLVLNGLSNIWISFRTTRAFSNYSKNNEPIDIEFK